MSALGLTELWSPQSCPQRGSLGAETEEGAASSEMETM